MYEVGQVLYLVASKTAKIVPARVTAITTTKTMEGEATSHELEFADAPGQSAKLEDLNVEVFKTGQELQKFMLTNATLAVEQQVRQAEEKVVEWGVPVSLPKKRKRRTRKKVPAPASSAPGLVEAERLEKEMQARGEKKVPIDLGDDVKANIILPADWT